MIPKSDNFRKKILSFMHCAFFQDLLNFEHSLRFEKPDDDAFTRLIKSFSNIIVASIL